MSFGNYDEFPPFITNDIINPCETGNFQVIHDTNAAFNRGDKVEPGKPCALSEQPENISLIIKRDAFSHVNEGARGTGRECFM